MPPDSFRDMTSAPLDERIVERRRGAQSVSVDWSNQLKGRVDDTKMQSGVLKRVSGWRPAAVFMSGSPQITRIEPIKGKRCSTGRGK